MRKNEFRMNLSRLVIWLRREEEIVFGMWWFYMLSSWFGVMDVKIRG